MHVFMTIPESKDAKASGVGVRTYYELDKDLFNKLNSDGHGIYKAVNSFSATPAEINDSGGTTSRQIKFLKKLNYVYADLDLGKSGDGQTIKELEIKKAKLEADLMMHCAPTMIIETRNGLQPLRKLDTDKVDQETQKLFVEVVNGVIQRSRTKGAAGDEVKDVTRVLRMPGFYHMKEEPYMVTMKKISDGAYTLEELKAQFPYTAPVKPVTNDYANNDDAPTLQFQELSKISIEEIVIAAYMGRGQSASFDSKGRVVVEGYGVTGNFKGKNGDGQYIASTSHDEIAGNRVTSVSKILDCNYSEAYKWLLDRFNIPTEQELKKKKAPEINIPNGDSSPLTFEQMGWKKFSTGNNIIDKDIGCLWQHNLVLMHGASKNGKTYFTMSTANNNGRPVSEGGYGHNVAFFSLEMDRISLKTQQASIRSGISRLQFQDATYTKEQWATYTEHYEGFDKYFTIFDEKDLGGDEGMELHSLAAQIEKLHTEKGYDMFIIDSLKLIGGQTGNESVWQGVVIQVMKKLKNKIPICIVLIHHNLKGGSTFSGSQDLENFVDWRIEVKKIMDPDADGVRIFNKSIIRVYKERYGNEIEYIFDFVGGHLRFEKTQSIGEGSRKDYLTGEVKTPDSFYSNY